MKECFFSSYLALGLPKFSPFRLKFNEKIQLFQEAGLIEKWTKENIQIFGKLLEEKRSETRKPTELVLKQVQGLFLVWALGIAACLIVRFLESYKRPIQNCACLN